MHYRYPAVVLDLAYFRVKLHCLVPDYELFVAETMAPGGQVVVLDCDPIGPGLYRRPSHLPVLMAEYSR